MIFVEIFLQTPNCPEQSVTLAAIGACHEKARSALQALGIDTVLLATDQRLAAPVDTHADMLFLHLGGDQGLCSMDCNGSALAALGFAVKIGESPCALYPKDALYNLLVMGEYAFCNPASASPAALELLQAAGKTIVPVKQGYTKCSCAVISRQAIISSDQGICAAARGCGLDVLCIRSGSINLKGYDYGFIGGCCGLIGKDRLAVCGDLATHPDGAAIKAFCRSHGVEVVSLYGGALEDIGSIVPLKERSPC